MTQRTSIFETPKAGGGIDVSDFAPAERARQLPRPEEIDAARVGSRFKSREPTQTPEVDRQQTKRKPMVYRTGRNVTFSAKTTKETVDQFYQLAEQNGWKAGETFERAVGALVRECREK